MKIHKLLFMSLYMIAFWAAYAKAQDKPGPVKWPVPANVPDLLFYIQRDPNINTVCYTLNLDKDGKLDQKEPIDIFWMKYADDGKKKKLNAFQREFGYGLSFSAVNADSFIVKAVAFPNRIMHLIKDEHKKYVVEVKISGQTCVLKRVFIHITGETALSPEIKYIEFYGFNPKVGHLVTERINLD